MWEANSTWRKRRIQAELARLGIRVSDSTVLKYRPQPHGPPSQSWKSFLRNHMSETVALDFFTVATVRFKVLYVLLVMSHERRRLVHFNVTH
jgi:putative transposase